VNDLSWSRKVAHPSEFVKRDEKIDVIVLEIEPENRKLRLGHKQLTEDPWETLETVFPIESIHKGTITQINDKGAVIELEYGVEGFAPKKHLKIASGKENFKEGDSLDVMVIEFNKDLKKIVLSHSRTWSKDEEFTSSPTSGSGAAKKRAPVRKKKDGEVEVVSKSNEKDTLGDVSGLAKLKASMGGDKKAAEKEDSDSKTAKKKVATKRGEDTSSTEDVTEGPKAKKKAKSDDEDEKSDTKAKKTTKKSK